MSRFSPQRRTCCRRPRSTRYPTAAIRFACTACSSVAARTTTRLLAHGVGSADHGRTHHIHCRHRLLSEEEPTSNRRSLAEWRVCLERFLVLRRSLIRFGSIICMRSVIGYVLYRLSSASRSSARACLPRTGRESRSGSALLVQSKSDVYYILIG